MVWHLYFQIPFCRYNDWQRLEHVRLCLDKFDQPTKVDMS